MSNTNSMFITDALAPATMPTIAADALPNSNSSGNDADAAIAAAIAAADADASAEDAQEMLAASIADDITKVFDSALPQLLAIRDSTYANAIEALDSESDALAKEYGELQTAIQDIKAILPSEERLIRHQADGLLHDGRKQDAANKLDELKEFQHKTVAMQQRMNEIHDRFQSINHEKLDISQQVVEKWLAKVVRPVIKVSEHGLLVTMLSGLEQSLYTFRDSTGIKIHQGHIIGLTADEKSQEWKAARHWYGM